MDIDFQIFINGEFINFYLSFYFEVTGVTILVTELFTYRNILLCKSRCHNFGIRAGFRPGSDPGWRFVGTWF